MRYVMDKGKVTEDELLDFANMVFSMEYTGIDFSVYLPKAYGSDIKKEITHHMLRDDLGDRLIGLIDTYPMMLKLDGLSISADYVGTVAVHPRYRKMGCFTNLIDKVYKEAVSKKTDLLILDGERARYANFGYEKAGTKYAFNVDYKCALSRFESLYGDDELSFPAYSFEEAEGDSPLIDKMYRLYMKRNVTARERDDFYASLLSNKASVYAVMKNGQFAGYINMADNEKGINEFELCDEADMPRLMIELMEGFDLTNIAVSIGADEISKFRQLEPLSSYYSVLLSHQIRILNYERVIAFLLCWKMKYADVSDGEYVFGIEKDGKSADNYKICVNNKKVTVKKTRDKANDIFKEMEFVRVMTTGYYYMENKKAPAGWFPLPFYLPDADTF